MTSSDSLLIPNNEINSYDTLIGKHLLNYIKRWLLAHTEYDEKELNQLLAGGWDKVIIDIKMIFFFDSYYAPFL